MIKKLLIAVCLMACASTTYALGKLQGYVEQGGNSVTVAGFLSQTKVQKSFPSATVTVYLNGTSTLATLYADSALTAKANPFTAASDGKWEFYAADGDYDVRFSGGGIAVPYTWSGFRIGNGYLAPVNLRSFGATGDGVTSDQTAITNWLAFCQANVVACYAPRGSYVFTESMTWTGNGFELYGDGMGLSLFINKAAANKPSIVLDNAYYWHIRDLGFIGRATFPNKAMEFRVNAGGTQCAAFGKISNVLLAPNGVGIHFNGTAVGPFGGINSFDLNHIYYWPSGYNGGATADAGTRKHAILADGNIVNAVKINQLNAVGVDKTIAGHSCIKWNTTLSSDITVRNSELEGIDLMAVDFTGVWYFSISDTYTENSQLKFTNCRYGTINVYNPADHTTSGAKAVDLFGSAQVLVTNTIAGTVNATFRADAASAMVGLLNSSFTTYSNSSPSPFTLNSVSGAVLADQIGTDKGFRERGRSYKVGDFTTPAFNAADFAGTGGATWTVSSDDVVTYQWRLIGTSLLINFYIATSDISVAAAPNVTIKIPNGFISTKNKYVANVLYNDGTWKSGGVASVLAGGTVISIIPKDLSGNFPVGALYVLGSIEFEVNP